MKLVNLNDPDEQPGEADEQPRHSDVTVGMARMQGRYPGFGPQERETLEACKDRVLRESGVPRKDMDLIRSGGLVATAAVRAVRESGGPMLLVLSGGTGVGKTTAASAAIADFVADDDHWIQRLYSWTIGSAPLFVTAAQLSRWKIYDRSEVAKLFEPRLLVLDDAGAEFAEGRLLATIDELINERYAASHFRRTIITTNLTVTAFRERYGERVADRVIERGKFLGLGQGSLRGRQP